jgi:hypothetical protein
MQNGKRGPFMVAIDFLIDRIHYYPRSETYFSIIGKVLCLLHERSFHKGYTYSDRGYSISVAAPGSSSVVFTLFSKGIIAEMFNQTLYQKVIALVSLLISVNYDCHQQGLL